MTQAARSLLLENHLMVKVRFMDGTVPACVVYVPVGASNWYDVAKSELVRRQLWDYVQDIYICRGEF